jgi:hypothetical protein
LKKHIKFVHQKIKTMQELIDRLKANAGITDEQATKALETIKDFVKEKFPMLGGAVDNMFGSAGKADEDEL